MKPIDKLIEAAEDGETDEVTKLLGKHPELLEAHNEEFGWTALHRGAQFGHTKIVRLLLKLGASPSPMDFRRNTPLHDAAMCYRHPQTAMKLLIGAGAEIDRRNTNWETPLFVATQYANLSAFRYLLDHGARTFYRDRRGLNALDMANYQLENITNRRKYANQIRELEQIIGLLS